MTTAIAAARERHVARAIELATGLGHDICMGVGPVRTECGRCLKAAIRRDLSYGPAATKPCPPIPEYHWNPYDDNDTGQAYYERLTAVRQRLGLIDPPPP
jgi:hypothetical protein